MLADTLVNDLPQLLLTHQEVHLQAELLTRHRAIDKTQVLGDGLVEDEAAHKWH